jgi:YesN/AraC family two-component response regulator
MKIWESRLKREERFVHQVQCIVRKNLFSPELSLQFIGNLLGYTPAYTGSCYKQITGTKLMDYIHKQRIEAAIDLIRQGNRTIGEISREVGFVNEAYFSTVFKKHTGASPSSFRDR